MGWWKPPSNLQSHDLATKSYIFFIRYAIIWLKKCQKKCLKCGKFSAVKNGNKRGKNRFRCSSCFYQWVEKRGKRINCSKAYKHWLLGRRTLAEICNDLDVSYPKLNKEFDRFDMSEGLLEEALQDLNQPINLLIDATFF